MPCLIIVNELPLAETDLVPFILLMPICLLSLNLVSFPSYRQILTIPDTLYYKHLGKGIMSFV